MRFSFIIYPFAKYIMTPLNILKNKGKSGRILDIGPGISRIPNTETVNIVWGKDVDYIADASTHLPFPDQTFDVVHASHILEHIPWYQLSKSLKEWTRVLKSGGTIEIWVPDGYKLSKFLCDIEEGIQRNEWMDNWRPLNAENCPYKWVNGRILYGVRTDYPSWHTSIITPAFLESMLKRHGLTNIRRMAESEARGVKHGWINLGMKGTKP
jgi:SAM-dependent methyltransferase